MPTTPASLPEDDRRAAFDAALRERGIAVAAAEAGEAYKVAAWMDDGVAGLAARLPGDVEAPVQVDGSAADLSITEAGARLRDGSLTSVALVEAHLRRIAARDPVYRAFYQVLADRAREAARRADTELAAGIDRGPLHGIPVGIKDLIDIDGLPTTAGSRLRQHHVAHRNAAVIERLVDGGAIIIGKLATYEFATVGPAFDTLHPPARNPWNLDHITGGSSSGCAVAVAGGLLRTTIGSDTGGSVRGPASYCGVVGLKPTFGLVDTEGSVELSPSLDHLGPMSATTAEAALTLDVVSGRSGDDRAAARLGQPVAGLRIAYARNWFAAEAQAEVVAAMDEAVSTLSQLGAIVEPVDLPDYPAIEVAAAAIIQREALDLHAADLAAHPDAYGRQTFRNLISGALLNDVQVVEARRAGAVFRQRLDDEVFAGFDALVTVCALTTALPVKLFEKGAVWTPMRTIGFNVSGHPALALPIGFADGLPMGMQIVGRHHGEAVICQLGDAFERGTDHALRRPPAPGTAG
jgi:Asp-tRNA(Asn)/Glu-tRNA(Gln) amidotransferase A subunit family amidase